MPEDDCPAQPMDEPIQRVAATDAQELSRDVVDDAVDRREAGCVESHRVAFGDRTAKSELSLEYRPRAVAVDLRAEGGHGRRRPAKEVLQVLANLEHVGWI